MPLKQLTRKSGVRHSVALGQSFVNPCYTCELADMTGVTDICGRCRSRPIVSTSFLIQPFLGLTIRTCGDLTPRTTYVRRQALDSGDEGGTWRPFI